MLGRLVDKANAMDLLREFEVGKERAKISLNHFADDTLFFVKNDSHLKYLVEILLSFCEMPGFTVNLEKKVHYWGLIANKRKWEG